MSPFQLLKVRRNRLILGAVALCAVLTLLRYSLTRKAESDDLQAQFDAKMAESSLLLQRSVIDRLRGLQQVKAPMASLPQLSRDEFQSLAEFVQRQQPEILALYWVPRVYHKDRTAFENRAKSEGLSSYHISEHTPYQHFAAAAERESYYPMHYRVPSTEKDIPSFGYDLGSSSFHLKALKEAVDSGQPRITPSPETIETDGPGTTVTVFDPIYYGGDVPTEPAMRRRTHIGFIVAELHVGKLLESFRAQSGKLLTYYIFDTEQGRKPQFLYMYDAPQNKVGRVRIQPEEALADYSYELRTARTIPVGGREWKLVFLATGDYLPRPVTQRWKYLLEGLALAALLSLALLLAEGEVTPKTVAQARESELRKSMGQEINAEQSKRKGMESELDNLKRLLFQRIAERDSAAAEAQRFSRRVSELEDECKSHLAAREALEREKLALSAQVRITADKADTALKDAERRLKALEERRAAESAAAAASARTGDEVTKLRKRLDEEQRINRSLLEQIAQLKNERHALEREKSEVEAQLDEALLRVAKPARGENVVTDLEKKFAEQVVTLQKLGHELAQEKNRIGEIEAAKENFRKELAEKTNRIRTMERALGEWKRAAEESRKKQAELEKQLRDVEDSIAAENEHAKERERLQSELAAAQQHSTDLQKQLDEYEKVVLSLEESRDRAEERAASFARREAELQGIPPIDQSRDELVHAQEKIAELQDALRDEKKLREDLVAELERVKSEATPSDNGRDEMVQLEAKLQDQQELISILNQELEHIKQLTEEQRNAQGDLERKIAEKSAALAASEARYRNLTQISPVGIFYTDLEGRYVYVNEHYVHISGLTFDQNRGEGWLQAIHAEDRDHVVRHWHKAVREKGRFSAEFRYLYKDGSTRKVLAQAVAENTGPDGKVTGFVGTILELTERKRA